MEGLGARLKARARELDLTDTEVARRLGMSQSRYTQYANDKREPDFATFVQICEVLSIRPDQALGFDAIKPAGKAELLRRGIATASASMNVRTLRIARNLMLALLAS